MRISLIVALSLLSGGAAFAQRGPELPPGPSRAVSLPSGRTWEKIQLKYVDVRVIAAALGARVLPTEADLFAMRMGYGRMGGYGGYGGYGGRVGSDSRPYGGGYGVIGSPYSNSLVVVPGARPIVPNGAILADPRTNSLIVDP